MPTPEVEEFARLLVTHVRDQAIASCDIGLRPGARNVTALRWRKAIESLTHQDFAREIIPDCVDEAIFYLLHAIDEGLLQVRFVASNGEAVDLTKEGRSEMAGWYAGTGGWVAAHSKERFNDDLSDLDGYTGPEAP